MNIPYIKELIDMSRSPLVNGPNFKKVKSHKALFAEKKLILLGIYNEEGKIKKEEYYNNPTLRAIYEYYIKTVLNNIKSHVS